jgi:hypothetical protein
MGDKQQFHGWVDPADTTGRLWGRSRTVNPDGTEAPPDPDASGFTLPHPASPAMVDLFGGAHAYLTVVAAAAGGPAIMPRHIAEQEWSPDHIAVLLRAGRIAFYPSTATPPDLVAGLARARDNTLRVWARNATAVRLLIDDLSERDAGRTGRRSEA